MAQDLRLAEAVALVGVEGQVEDAGGEGEAGGEAGEEAHLRFFFSGVMARGDGGAARGLGERYFAPKEWNFAAKGGNLGVGRSCRRSVKSGAKVPK